MKWRDEWKKNVFQNFGSFSLEPTKQKMEKMECSSQPAVVASQMSMRYPHLSLCDLVRWPRFQHGRCHFYSPIITLSNSRDNVNMYFFSLLLSVCRRRKLRQSKRYRSCSAKREKMQSGKEINDGHFMICRKRASVASVFVQRFVGHLSLSFRAECTQTKKTKRRKKINI